MILLLTIFELNILKGDKEEEILKAPVPGVNVPYEWDAGEHGSKFLAKIRDEEKILATKCSNCGRSYIPPRNVCPDCFEEISEWVEVAEHGELVTYTVVNYEEPLIQPEEPPLIYGIIKLDGADTGLVHLLGEIEPADLKHGIEVEAVFRDESEREGNILDIKYFKPVK